jgi:hypothetical protein
LAKTTSSLAHDARITEAARERNMLIIDRLADQPIELEPKYLVQMAHLTTPATVWKYVEGAATKSAANLVMLDLEDSIPRDNAELLEHGRANVIRAFNELDWGRRLRFFRPRGLELDPAHEDIAVIVEQAGAKIDGLIYPKIECADEVRSLDLTLGALEKTLGLKANGIRIEVLIRRRAGLRHRTRVTQAGCADIRVLRLLGVFRAAQGELSRRPPADQSGAGPDSQSGCSCRDTGNRRDDHQLSNQG